MPDESRSKISISACLALAIILSGGMLLGYGTSQALGKGHDAHHGGVLNVIGDEVGHAEIRLTGDTAELWFVGGGNDTNRAVPVKADKLTLTVEKELVLDAAPLVLAGESAGDCSHFTAQARWLSAMEEFDAYGRVLFKGQEYELHIHYPHGYDPHHGHGHEHEHSNHEQHE